MAQRKADRNTDTRLIGTICLVSVAFVLFIQDVVRPKLAHMNAVCTFLQGTLPNFFAATALIPLLYLLTRHTLKTLSASQAVSLATFTTVAGLSGWECLRSYYGNRPFDRSDIYMTLLGAFLIALLLNRLVSQGTR